MTDFVDTINAPLTELMGARFSADRTYRYALWRTWDTEKPRMMVIGLNPSTADEIEDDPTIRRCIGFAKRDGYGGLSMLNLYAWRATRPEDMVQKMVAGVDVVGPENNRYITAFAVTSRIVVCSWGAFDFARSRGADVMALLYTIGITPHCFGLTPRGAPRHPLYLRGDTPIIPFGRA